MTGAALVAVAVAGLGGAVTLRTIVRARRDLVRPLALADELRAHLQVCFPTAVGLFAELDSAISLVFLRRLTDQARADCLPPKRLAAWASPSRCSSTAVSRRWSPSR